MAETRLKFINIYKVKYKGSSTIQSKFEGHLFLTNLVKAFHE
jgi:hypothetical protein